MTNREDEGDPSCESRVAALLAVHLVSQVLEEAYVVANAALESAQPWPYLDVFKTIRSAKIGDESVIVSVPKEDDAKEITESKLDVENNMVATSTPQKVAAEFDKMVNETSLIGQGDEDNELHQNELSNSTSMFINHLFDMSEVEHVVICNDTEIIQSDSKSNEYTEENMAKLINTALDTLGITFDQGHSDQYRHVLGDVAFCVDNNVTYEIKNTDDLLAGSAEVTEITQYEVKALKKNDTEFYENTYLSLNRDYDQCSDEDGDPVLQDPKCMSLKEVELMAEHISDDDHENSQHQEPNSQELTTTLPTEQMAKLINIALDTLDNAFDHNISTHLINVSPTPDVTCRVDSNITYGNIDTEGSSGGAEVNEITHGVEKEFKKNDVALYESAYLSLNRDYDQCSDDDGDPVLQDPKSMTMQEVELLAVHSSDENSPRQEPEEQKNKELTAISAVSASSRKSSLVQRCRTQGARLLACLRGWWRRKTPGKRKEARIPGSMRGLYPLSPDARRRASSLIDQRRLCSSPLPSQHVVWKFNTVSEALVNSSRWKNYTFDENPDECSEL